MVMPVRLPVEDYRLIRVRPLTLGIGAEVEGIELGNPLAAGTVAEIRRALIDWKVLFFRGQHLDHAAHVRFARRFGEPTIGHPVFGHDPVFPEIYSVAKERTANSHRDTRVVTPWYGWHTDITAAINPPMASILRGDVIPPYGGDTCWTDLGAACRGLSEPLRRFVEGLRGVHRFSAPPARVAGGDAYAESLRSRVMASEHPLVTVHPESGERILFANPGFLRSIVGLAPREGEKILELLWEQIIRPEYTVRFRWSPGDVAFWDNRSTAHLAPSDIFDTEYDRQLYRVTLLGEIPVGVDGRPSQALEGAPILPVEAELARRA
ncbi:MAG: TauD/TfdA family dioxygenase [Pseudomonadales bacterium]|nr:TauD/TfdA family dioxygenase [Pseudomonadales bacterium]